MSIVPIIIYFVILAVIIYAAKIVLGMLELPAQVVTLIWLAVAVIVVVAVARILLGAEVVRLTI